MERSAEATMNIIGNENFDKSNSTLFVLLTAIFTSELVKSLFDEEV